MKLDDAMGAVLAGTTSSASAGASPTAHGQAWRREMERAQADAWFHGFAGRRGGDAVQPAVELQAAPGHGGVDDLRTASATAVAWQTDAHTSAARLLSVQQVLAARKIAVCGPALPPAYQAAAASGDASNRALALEVWTQPRAASPFGIAEPGTAFPGVTVAQDAAVGFSAQPLVVTGTDGEPPPNEPEVEGGGTSAELRAHRRESTRLPVRVHVEGDEHAATVWLGVDIEAAVDLPAVTRAIAQWLAQAGYGRATWMCNGQALQTDPASADAPANEPPSGRATTLFPVIEPTQGESS